MPPHNYTPATNPQPAFWSSHDTDAFHTHRTTETLPTHSDIVIIGAGYAGASTAWHLKQDRSRSLTPQSIAILEARGICSGATGRNGGHLRPDLYGHIPKYIQRAGLEAAVELAEFEIAHVAAIKDVVEREGIDCDFVLTRSVDVWENAAAAEKAREVYEEMCLHGVEYMKDVFFKAGPEAEKLSGVKGAKAMASYTAAHMWAYKFVRHILKSLVKFSGVNLQTFCPVERITQNADRTFTIDTARGKIIAKKVVHANNAYVAGLLPEYSQSIIPCKGICCRITVPKDSSAPHMATSYVERTKDSNLSYLIPRPDGSIVVGGASNLFKAHPEQWYNQVNDDKPIESALSYYEGYMQRTFRGWEDSQAQIDQIWSGVMGYSYDSNSHIGEVPDRPGQYIIAGFNGHGMPVIWLGAKGLAKMINEGVEFENTGIPRLLKTTRERVERARDGKEEFGDILGDGSLVSKDQ